MRFVCERLHADGPDLVPAYAVDGGPVPDQRQLDLPGYPGGFDLVGNWVNRQFQLDGLGEALLLLAAAARHDRLDTEGWRAAEIAADAVAKRWQEPDAGIWEIDNQAWTHSRLTCVAGLRAAARSCDSQPQATDWSGLADAIMARTASAVLDVPAAGSGQPDDPAVDAALLLPPIRGALPADDPRTWRRYAATWPSSPRTATPIGSGTTRGRWVTPRAPSCSAGSSWPWRCTSRATKSAPPGGSSAPGPRAVPPACTPRNTT